MSTAPAAAYQPRPVPLDQLGSSPMPMQGAPHIAVSPHRWTSVNVNHHNIQDPDSKCPWSAMLKSGNGMPPPPHHHPPSPFGGPAPFGASVPPSIIPQFQPALTPAAPVMRRATEAPVVHRHSPQLPTRPPMAVPASSSLQNTPRRPTRDFTPMFFSPQPPRPRQIAPTPQQQQASMMMPPPPTPQASTRTYRWPPIFSDPNKDALGASTITTTVGPMYSMPNSGVAREFTAPGGRQLFGTPMTAGHTGSCGASPFQQQQQQSSGVGLLGAVPLFNNEIQGRVVRRIRIGIDGTVKSIEDLTGDANPQKGVPMEGPAAVTRSVTTSLPGPRSSQMTAASASTRIEAGGTVVTTSLNVSNKPPLAPRFQPLTSQTQAPFPVPGPGTADQRTRVQARVWGAVSGGKIDSTFQAGTSQGYVYEEG